jgi:phosphomethylpyrimidine synthase
MSDARRRIDWETMFDLAIDSQKARAYFESKPPAEKDSCSMCGKMCAMRTTNRILNKENVEFCG